MRKYELLLTLPGTLDEKEAADKSESVRAMVKEYGAEVEMNNLGKIRLAYPIKQIRYGYYYTLVFEVEANRLPELQDKLRLDREFLRFMISYYNTSLTTKEKIMYTTTDTGVTMMQEKPAAGQPVRREEVKKISLEEIDKKLDAILDNEIIP